MPTLGDYLKDKNITQEAFAARVGTTQETVSKWVNGGRMPRRSHLAKIVAETAGAVTANDFLGAAEEADAEPDGDPPPDPATVRAAADEINEAAA